MDQDTIAAIAEVSRAFGIAETNEKSAAVLDALLERLRGAVNSYVPRSFDIVMEILAQIEAELQLSLPNPIVLVELNTELHRLMAARLNQAAKGISEVGKTDIFGADAAEQGAKLKMIADRINRLFAKKVAQINALTALILAANQTGATPPLAPPIDSNAGDGDDDGMLKRIEKLETDVAAIKTDVAVIKANGATKSDIAELKGSFGELRASTKADIADAKTAIILWVAGAIFIAQLLPSILKMFVK
jgi:hypothetical protein